MDPNSLDLLYVFFWADRYHHRFQIPKAKVVREVASFRWQTEAQFGRLSAERFAQQYLDDCLFVTTPARSLRDALAGTGKEVFVCPNGFEPALFYPGEARKGPLRVGWVGNPNDASKGLQEILIPATQGRWELRYTDRSVSRARVARLYRGVDVIAIASVAESQPLPLIEGMASGCFPVTCNVGIVPEVVTNGVNGMIVDRSERAFRSAFEWCNANLDFIRSAGSGNAAFIRRARTWDACAGRFDDIFTHAISLQRRGQGTISTKPPAAEPSARSRDSEGAFKQSPSPFRCRGARMLVKKMLILSEDFAVCSVGHLTSAWLPIRSGELLRRSLPRSWLLRLKSLREFLLRHKGAK